MIKIINTNANRTSANYVIKTKKGREVSFAKTLLSLKKYYEDHESMNGKDKYPEHETNIDVLKEIDLNLVKTLEQWRQEPRYNKPTHWFQKNTAITDHWVKTVKLPYGVNPSQLTLKDKQEITNYFKEYLNDFKAKYYPNNELIGASIHWDETNPHIHFQFLNYDSKTKDWSHHRFIKDNILKIKAFEEDWDYKYIEKHQSFVMDKSTAGLKRKQEKVLAKKNGQKVRRLCNYRNKELKEAFRTEDARFQVKYNYLIEIQNHIENHQQIINDFLLAEEPIPKPYFKWLEGHRVPIDPDLEPWEIEGKFINDLEIIDEMHGTNLVYKYEPIYIQEQEQEEQTRTYYPSDFRPKNGQNQNNNGNSQKM